MIAATVVWVRLRRVWPFLATLAVVAAETVQYFAGMAGALWLHIPLGVMTIVALVVLFIAVWRRPLRRRPQPPPERVQTVEEPEQQEADEREHHDDRSGPAHAMTRRQVLGIGGALGLMAATGLSASAALSRRPPFTGAELRSAVPLPPAFQVPLPLPSVLARVNISGGVDRYEITQREAIVEILPGVRTRLWTYEGTFPGPTIESRRGRPITVTHRNDLPVPTVMHLHGGRTPADSDGYPTDRPRPA
ncbi:multicopper oxidase domain-containing protein [Pseudonocardia nigra]|uniref:multicopper oxidase domain-containing protein n=1 Tax=Pseudonocardia nigra TaxID=1921578 RepID=UPI0027E3232C|nr:multicopper oxidase domain-containing protein [Pseudonocardia nigra]